MNQKIYLRAFIKKNLKILKIGLMIIIGKIIVIYIIASLIPVLSKRILMDLIKKKVEIILQ
jgi:hypothetical protein